MRREPKLGAASPGAMYRSPTAPPVPRAARLSFGERLANLPNDLIILIMEWYMSAVSPEVAHAMSIALALCLNIVLAASVYSDVESEHTSQKRQNFYDEAGIPRTVVCGAVLLLSALNSIALAFSSRSYTVLNQRPTGFDVVLTGPRHRFLAVWNPNPAQLRLFCWLSPPHVLAIALSHDLWALICNIWVALCISSCLSFLDFMYQRQVRQLRDLHSSVYQEVERSVRTPPVTSHYCSSMLRGTSSAAETPLRASPQPRGPPRSPFASTASSQQRRR